MPTNKDRVLSLVAKIPSGRIVSYGQIATLLDLSPRIVGFIMSGLNDKESEQYPWHRVVNRDGYISSSKLGPRGVAQQALLEKEGVEVTGFQIVKPEKYWYRL